MRGLWRDLVVSGRLFRRSPGLAASVAVTIGLGVGGSMAIFGLLHAGLMAPSPFRDPSSLVVLRNAGRYFMGGALPAGTESPRISRPDFGDIEAQTRALSQVGAWTDGTGILTGGDRPRPVWRMLVTPRLLTLLGPRPIVGRLLDPRDFAAGAPAAAMITEAAWRDWFASRPDVAGSSIRIDDQAFTLVGVLPDTVVTALSQPKGALEEPHDKFVVSPMVAGLVGSETPHVRFAERMRDLPAVDVVGRLAPGQSLAAARAEMGVISGRLAKAYPSSNGRRAVRLEALDAWRAADTRRTLALLLAAAALVFLVACANAAGLVVADSIRHSGEAALRQALGAGPLRLVALQVCRAVMLALPGGLLAGVLAAATLAFVDRTLSDGSGAILRTLLLPRVALAGAAVTLLAGVLAGLAAAWSARWRNVSEALKEGGLAALAGRKRHLATRAFVALQIAGATVLVLGAGLMIRTVWNILAVDPGFDVRQGLVLQLRLPAAHYRTGPDYRTFFDAALDRVRALPDVSSAGLAVTAPLTDTAMLLTGAGLETPAGHRALPDMINAQRMSPGCLEALGVRLIRGRWFTDADARGGGSAVIVDRAFCRKYLAGLDPLTVKVSLGRLTVPIVGVVGDVRSTGPLATARDTLYMVETFERPARWAFLVVKAGTTPGAIAGRVLREVQSVDPTVAVDDPQTVSQLFAGTFATRRRLLVLLGGAAVLVLLLTALGLVSALTEFVAGRRRDIAIRLALGAGRRHVAELLAGHVVWALALGLAGGSAAGLALSSLLSAELVGVQAADPSAFGVALVVPAGLALAAAVGPIWRASRIEPATTLRAQ